MVCWIEINLPQGQEAWSAGLKSTFNKVKRHDLLGGNKYPAGSRAIPYEVNKDGLLK